MAAMRGEPTSERMRVAQHRELYDNNAGEEITDGSTQSIRRTESRASAASNTVDGDDGVGVGSGGRNNRNMERGEMKYCVVKKSSEDLGVRRVEKRVYCFVLIFNN